MAKVDADEKELLESVEHGEWRSAGGCKRERTRYARHAKATFRKDRRLNIRLSSKDLEAIDARQTGHRSRTRRLRCSSRAAAAAGLLYGVHAIMMGQGQGRYRRARTRRVTIPARPVPSSSSDPGSGVGDAPGLKS